MKAYEVIQSLASKVRYQFNFKLKYASVLVNSMIRKYENNVIGVRRQSKPQI